MSPLIKQKQFFRDLVNLVLVDLGGLVIHPIHPGIPLFKYGTKTNIINRYICTDLTKHGSPLRNLRTGGGQPVFGSPVNEQPLEILGQVVNSSLSRGWWVNLFSPVNGLALDSWQPSYAVVSSPLIYTDIYKP